MKGLVFSISTLLLASFLILTALFLQNRVLSENADKTSVFAIEKAGFVFDDIASDFNRLLGTNIDVNRTVSLTTITFTDTLPSDLNKYGLRDYNSFIHEKYALQQNAVIKLNPQNLLDGKTELVFSNALQYDYNYSNQSSILFYAPNADSNVLRFDINVTVNDSSIARVPWNLSSSGDINVVLNFADQNASNTVSVSGLLDSNIENTYRFDYNASSNDYFLIKVGRINANIKAVQFLELFQDSDTQAQINVKAYTPTLQTELVWFYDADLNYVQNNVSFFKKIELGRS